MILTLWWLGLAYPNFNQAHLSYEDHEKLKARIFRELREEDISKWKPSVVDREEPPPHIWVKSYSIEGGWAGHTGGDCGSTTISIRHLQGDRYKLFLSTFGCMQSYSLSRTATYKNGTLLLDRAVKEYAFETYDRLYTVRVHGEVRLVYPLAFSYLRDSKGGDKEHLMRFLSFGRQSVNRTKQAVDEAASSLHHPRKTVSSNQQ